MSKMVYVDIYTLEDSVHLKVSGLKKKIQICQNLKLFPQQYLCADQKTFFLNNCITWSTRNKKSHLALISFLDRDLGQRGFYIIRGFLNTSPRFIEKIKKFVLERFWYTLKWHPFHDNLIKWCKVKLDESYFVSIYLLLWWFNITLADPLHIRSGWVFCLTFSDEYFNNKTNFITYLRINLVQIQFSTNHSSPNLDHKTTLEWKLTKQECFQSYPKAAVVNIHQSC